MIDVIISFVLELLYHILKVESILSQQIILRLFDTLCFFIFLYLSHCSLPNYIFPIICWFGVTCYLQPKFGIQRDLQKPIGIIALLDEAWYNISALL